MYVYKEEIRSEGPGDIYLERMCPERTVLEGEEAAKGEFDLSRCWPEEGVGDVFSDRAYGEWPRMRGYEVPEV
jgi:hypothetical protein